MRKTLLWALVLALSGAAGAAGAAEKKKSPSAPAKPAEAKPAPAAEPKTPSLKCVGIYSETDGGYISYRTGSGAWTVVKVGDTIPADAEVKVNVDRDWVEFTPSDNPVAVYELNGENGEVTKKVADIVKGTPKAVKFPKASGETPDPAFKDKLVVVQYLGRQVYTDANGDDRDIKYGDVLEVKGKVAIIAINNTLTLMNAGGKVTTVIGPLKFDVEKVLKNEQLYKFLNTGR
ncbi:MAG TPA: hypothetical protein VMU15_12925 [Anaeromyxobacter sp.]|nr:hypothetical protein [Anaeromyxobacter sp.]